MEDLQRQLNELKDWKASLERSSTIPLSIDQAFRERFKNNKLLTSTKSATSENQAVDEGGASTYSVLKAPDGFVEVYLDDGTLIYLPYFQ